MYACLILPFPPSVNSIIACMGNRRIKTARHRDYLGEAGLALDRQKFPMFSSPVSVEMAMGRPDKRVRDIDNHAKAVLDALTAHKVLEDDSLVHRLLLYWSTEVVGVRVEITPV